MTEPIRLCKDCLYYKKSWLGHLFGSSSLDVCHNPRITGDVVTGDKNYISCEEARNYGFYCGKDGNYFEQLWGDRK